MQMKRKLRRGRILRRGGVTRRRQRCSGRMEGKMDRGAEVKEEKEENVERRGEGIERRLFAKRTLHGAFLLILSVSCYKRGAISTIVSISVIKLPVKMLWVIDHFQKTTTM